MPGESEGDGQSKRVRVVLLFLTVAVLPMAWPSAPLGEAMRGYALNMLALFFPLLLGSFNMLAWRRALALGVIFGAALAVCIRSDMFDDADRKAAMISALMCNFLLSGLFAEQAARKLRGDLSSGAAGLAVAAAGGALSGVLYLVILTAFAMGRAFYSEVLTVFLEPGLRNWSMAIGAGSVVLLAVMTDRRH